MRARWYRQNRADGRGLRRRTEAEGCVWNDRFTGNDVLVVGSDGDGLVLCFRETWGVYFKKWGVDIDTN